MCCVLHRRISADRPWSSSLERDQNDPLVRRIGDRRERRDLRRLRRLRVDHGCREKPTHSRIAFSEFLSAIEAGQVDQLAVSGRIYTFHSGARVLETVGPKLGAADLASLHSSDPALPAPKITTGSL